VFIVLSGSVNTYRNVQVVEGEHNSMPILTQIEVVKGSPDFGALNAKQTHCLLNFAVDADMEQILEDFQQEQTLTPGEVVGSFSFNTRDRSSNPFTAVCKSDCLLLKVNSKLFAVLHERKLRRQREQLALFLVEKFP